MTPNMRPLSIAKPERDLVIWRYLPFNHFEDLIATKEIFLPRIDQFEKNDKHEGYVPMANTTAPAPHEIAAQRHAWAWRFLYFASCWHIGSNENVLMWPSYGQGTGVVVKSTAGKLEDIVSFQPNAYTACVIYEDWPNPVPPGLLWQMPIRKRPEFYAEAELRIVMEDIDLMIMDDFPRIGNQPPANWPKFHRASFDGLPLIDEIRVKPGASAEFIDRVVQTTKFHGIEAPVRESRLAVKPVWVDPNI